MLYVDNIYPNLGKYVLRRSCKILVRAVEFGQKR